MQVARRAGEHEIEKFGTGAAVTVSEMPVLRVLVPSLPCAWMAYVLGAVLAETLSVSVLLAPPFAGGVTGLGV